MLGAVVEAVVVVEAGEGSGSSKARMLGIVVVAVVKITGNVAVAQQGDTAIAIVVGDEARILRIVVPKADVPQQYTDQVISLRVLAWRQKLSGTTNMRIMWRRCLTAAGGMTLGVPHTWTGHMSGDKELVKMSM